MATLESLEAVLADALERLDNAARLVRQVAELETEPNLKHLGAAVNSLWEIRERIHERLPNLKPPFVIECEQDNERYNKLSKVSRQAHELEDAGKTIEARSLFSSLHEMSGHGHFRTVAEAGLYRLDKRIANE